MVWHIKWSPQRDSAICTTWSWRSQDPLNDFIVVLDDHLVLNVDGQQAAVQQPRHEGADFFLREDHMVADQ